MIPLVCSNYLSCGSENKSYSLYHSCGPCLPTVYTCCCCCSHLIQTVIVCFLKVGLNLRPLWTVPRPFGILCRTLTIQFIMAKRQEDIYVANLAESAFQQFMDLFNRKGFERILWRKGRMPCPQERTYCSGYVKPGWTFPFT